MAATITLLWAQDRVGAIGRDSTIPWRVPEDMRRFRELTGADPVIMGRKTWESLPARFRPLPGRRNVVITRSATYTADGAEIVHTVDDALALVDGPVTVIGGGQIYEASMEIATHLRVTEIDILVEGADAFAPEIDPYRWDTAGAGEWLSSTTGLRYRFVDYVRHALVRG
ncbi:MULTISPECIES: dihydrofolate reductase [unclassified Gordonia (in: high G+C Gram-positive bacteria)]|uniref:dihydrofolate reductase n=1 Tax=unclassified Gordonia (in: high G+C Gram-positive bacteria) TaxID=2657482 RepID=UPI001F0F49C0|nr:dihydrofolate reductase [Gordonia sp. ABSL49_1]MCH5642454.1 dihydrofolate reductase [Gordonia sp. ABSL49_1]